jgi:hypothetical protein
MPDDGPETATGDEDVADEFALQRMDGGGRAKRQERYLEQFRRDPRSPVRLKERLARQPDVGRRIHVRAGVLQRRKRDVHVKAVASNQSAERRGAGDT